MYILSNKYLVESAKLLADKIELINEEEPMKVSTEPIKGDKLAFRWGTSMRIGFGDPNNTLNTIALISVAGNKKIFSNLLKKHNIPHVEINDGTPERFPVVVRKELNRGGGIGIQICKNMEEFASLSMYSWSYFYNFSTEVGVHILGGEVRKIFKKIWPGERPESEFPIRNTQNGYKFSLRNLNSYPKLIQYCRKLYEVFPIQFGRADVGWDEDNKIWRIIEFNSAPDLTQNSNTLDMYAEFLASKI